MPLSRTEKIIILGIGGGLALLGIAAAAKQASAPPSSLAPLTTQQNYIPPYINTGTIVVKQIGSDVGPSIQFATLPGTSLPAVLFTADNPFGTATHGYAYVTIPLPVTTAAKIVISAIEAFINNNAAWATITSRLNIWDQTGVQDSNYFLGTGSPGFITGFNLLPSTNVNKLESSFPSIDVSTKTALTLEVAFEGADFPLLTAQAWIAPVILTLSITPIVNITVHATTTGGLSLPGVSCTLTSQTTGSLIATASTDANGIVNFQNVLADNFALNATLGTVTHRSLFTATTNVLEQVTFPLPSPSFTMSPTNPSVGQAVTFNPTASTDPDPGAVPTSQTWLWGDGTSETILVTNPLFLQPVTHIYNTAGIFWPALSLSDSTGQIGVVQQQLIVGPPPVTVSVAVVDSAGVSYPNQTVHLTNTSTGVVLTATTNSQGIAVFANVPVATYTASATLVVGTAPGFTESTTAFLANGPTTITILFSRPEVLIDVFASIIFPVPITNADSGQSIIVSVGASSLGTPGYTTPLSVTINFGDGSPPLTGIGTVASHIYTGPASPIIQVSITNVTGLTGVGFLPFIVNLPLAGFFTMSPSPTGTGTPTVFNSTVTGGLGPYGYNWDFGDGTTSTLANPTHTYGSPGTYTVTLKITDATGTSVSTSTAETVLSPALLSRVYPVLLSYGLSAGVYALSLTGVLALEGNILADGTNDLLNFDTFGFAYNSVPVVSGGNGLYDIAEDFGNFGTINFTDFSIASFWYKAAVPSLALNSQTVTVEAYSPSSGGWITLGTSTTAPGTVPFRALAYARTLTAQGVFTFSQSNLPSDITQIRFNFAGNGYLKPSLSPPYGITQPLR